MPTSNRLDNSTSALAQAATLMAAAAVMNALTWTLPYIYAFATRVLTLGGLMRFGALLLHGAKALTQQILANDEIKQYMAVLTAFVSNPILRALQAFANIEQLPSGMVRDFYYWEAILDGILFAVAFAIPDPVVFELMGDASLSIKYLLLVPPMYLMRCTFIDVMQAAQIVWLQEGLAFDLQSGIDWHIVPALEQLRLERLPAKDFANHESIRALDSDLRAGGHEILAKAVLDLGAQGYTQLYESQRPLAKRHLLLALAKEAQGSESTINGIFKHLAKL